MNPGVIVVPNTGMLRHTQFVADLLYLEKPEGTHISLPTGGSVVQNLNKALVGLENTDLQWCWLQADDHCFPSDLLTRLLSHNLDVVCPLIVRRTGSELVFGEETEDVDQHSGRTYPAYKAWGIDDMPSQTDPFPVDIAGSAGMLVRRHVLDAIGYPYFETTDGLKLNEDIVFSKKIRAAGFQIHVDPQARMGHIIATQVWPA